MSKPSATKPTLTRCIQLLDQCEWVPKDPTEPSGECQCSRCGTKLDDALTPGTFVMCKKGRSELIGYSFYCPGCDQPHRFMIKPPLDEPDHHTWEFNGDEKYPTFSPSLRVVPEKDCHQCHLNLVEGKIHYAEDCSHPFKGQEVPLRPFPV